MRDLSRDQFEQRLKVIHLQLKDKQVNSQLKDKVQVSSQLGNFNNNKPIVQGGAGDGVSARRERAASVDVAATALAGLAAADQPVSKRASRSNGSSGGNRSAAAPRIFSSSTSPVVARRS